MCPTHTAVMSCSRYTHTHVFQNLSVILTWHNIRFVMSESQTIDDDKNENDSVSVKVNEGYRLYEANLYSECVKVLNECLSDAASEKGRPFVAELHLLLAKCHRGLDNLKDAVLSCNSAIEQRPGWKDPYLVRSACFQVCFYA